nr:MAG TPA: hypothetical protein [Caudoviricetes sp.]
MICPICPAGIGRILFSVSFCFLDRQPFISYLW